MNRKDSGIAKRNSGIAMVIITALLALMLGIVLSVVALNQAGGKHTAFFKGRQIALIMARAGVADALYRLNYRDYSAGNYPTTADPWLSENSPFGTDFAGSYTVAFTDDLVNINADKITSTGKYNGKIRKISIKIRGNNTASSLLNTITHGIAEAFNKHVIYANQVSYTSGTVNGNICSTTDLSATAITGNNTKIRVVAADFDPVATPLTLDTTLASWGITAPGSPTDFTDLPAAGPVTVGGITANYDGPDGIGTDTYTFSSQTINSDIRVRGNVVISGGTVSKYVIADDDDASASSNLTCTNATLSSGCVLYAEDSGTITLTYSTSATVHLYTNGTITINGNSTDTLTGNILGGSSITIKGNIISGSIVSAGNITLNTGASTITPVDNNGAIMSDSGNITIQNYSHNITGLIYAGGNVDIQGGTISGCVVSKGILTLTGGTCTYNSTNYETYPNATFARVYANFTGGRRIYVPVLDSWREE